MFPNPSRRALSALAFAIGLLVGAAGPHSALAAPAVAVQDDNFSPSATFVGPAQAINPLAGTYRQWRLRSWVNKSSHVVTHQLYVDTNYMWGRRSWDAATDDHAGEHRVVRIAFSAPGCRGRDKTGCVFYETVGVELDDDFVRQHADGFQIRLTARSGDDLILTVTAAQIAPVLEAIDAYLQRGASDPAAAEPAPARRRNGEASR